ncbi:MAG: hypothetical protein GY856_03980 [bacterium]|nr:hypothetical protein [bacterium]
MLESTDMTHDVKRLKAAFDAGKAAALDPANAPAAVTGGRATTTLQSPWLHLRCRLCGHTFRPGDEIELSGGVAAHASAALPCAGAAGSAPPASPEIAEFFAGLDETWPPPKNLAIIRLEDGHFLLAPPVAGFRRRSCAVCGHTFRPHDHVVLCPCFPDKPRCQVAIHRDPIHGLHCWEDWNPGAHKLHCPATSREIRRPPDGNEDGSR